MHKISPAVLSGDAGFGSSPDGNQSSTPTEQQQVEDCR